VVPTIEKELGRKVTIMKENSGDDNSSAIEKAKNGEVILLENPAFYNDGKGIGLKGKATKAENKIFTKYLTEIGDIYVNGTIGIADKARSSIVGTKVKTKVEAAFLVTSVPGDSVAPLEGDSGTSEKLSNVSTEVGNSPELVEEKQVAAPSD
jgi:phosphoglycerate kinase